jgi:hypothetical protein
MCGRPVATAQAGQFVPFQPRAVCSPPDSIALPTLHLFAEQLQLHNLLTQKTTDLRIGQRVM